VASLPDPIRRTLENLKKGYQPPSYLVLRRINGKYYVYKDMRPWDSERKKRKTISEYLGRIRDDGLFIRKESSKEDELENARSIIVAHGGRVEMPKEKRAEEAVQEQTTLREVDEKILTILSMNARATLPFIAKRVDLSVSAVENRVKNLEKRHGIRYLAEIDVDRLGFFKFIILAKFLDKVPDPETIRAIAEKDPRIQLAVMLTGKKYDLLMYMIGEKSMEITYLMRDVVSRARLGEYPAEWHFMTFYETYGFVPLRNEFLETLREKIVKKGRKNIDVLAPKREQIFEREFAVLKELNNDGSIEFTEIDRKYGFDQGRSQYAYGKLVEDGIIKRITLSMENVPLKYVGIDFLKITELKDYYETRVPFLETFIRGTDTLLTSYLLAGDIGSPYGSILFKPVFRDGELEELRKDLSKVKGLEVETATVTKTILGKFCYRKFDGAYSVQQQVLVDRYGYKQAKKPEYAEGAAKKKQSMWDL
jgi:Lrp/AsnC family leucine-responsive transcriptional regulator